MGKFLDKLQFDKMGKFVWSAVSHEEYSALGKPVGGQSTIADMFFNSVSGADFGIALLEIEKGEVNISFRSKWDTDVSVLARTLGGGGHKNAAGATLFGDFNNIIKKVLNKAKVTK